MNGVSASAAGSGAQGSNQMANRGIGTFAAALAFIALSAAPASALDGEVLINQAKANAGGITPNDDPGFPVRINRSGKYKLVGNLNVPAGKSGIAVVADNVTIDLNGFRIFGGDDANVGINAVNADGLTVMNGTISNFTSHGIVTHSFAVVQDMQISNNGGIGVKLDTNGRVLRSTMSENVSANVFCNSTCLIAQNVVARSVTESGIVLLTVAGGHLVLGNVISENQLYGIYAEGFSGFGNNTLTANNLGSISGTFIQPVHPNFCQPACP
jgi:hypothetical protein